MRNRDVPVTSVPAKRKPKNGHSRPFSNGSQVCQRSFITSQLRTNCQSVCRKHLFNLCSCFVIIFYKLPAADGALKQLSEILSIALEPTALFKGKIYFCLSEFLFMLLLTFTDNPSAESFKEVIFGTNMDVSEATIEDGFAAHA